MTCRTRHPDSGLHAGRAGLTIGLLLAGVLSACRSSPTTDPVAGDAHQSADPPGLTILDRGDAESVLDAQTVYLPRELTRRYLITASSDDTSGRPMVRRETTAADRFNAQWVTVESLITDNGPTPRSTTYWSVSGDGSVVMHASINHDDNAISLFKPPLILAYPELQPGESREQETSIRVVAENDPSRPKERGTAHQTITYAGRYTLSTPAGQVETRRMTVAFNADLSMADAAEHTELFISADRGIVAERRTRSVKVFGVESSAHDETLVLAAPN